MRGSGCRAYRPRNRSRSAGNSVPFPRRACSTHRSRPVAWTRSAITCRNRQSLGHGQPVFHHQSLTQNIQDVANADRRRETQIAGIQGGAGDRAPRRRTTSAEVTSRVCKEVRNPVRFPRLLERWSVTRRAAEGPGDQGVSKPVPATKAIAAKSPREQWRRRSWQGAAHGREVQDGREDQRGIGPAESEGVGQNHFHRPLLGAHAAPDRYRSPRTDPPD